MPSSASSSTSLPPVVSPTMSFSASAPSSFPSLASMASPSLAPPSASFSTPSSSLSPQPSSPPSSASTSPVPPTGRSSMSYSQKQRNKLEDFFLLSASLSREEEATQISRLSNDIGLTKDQIRGWLRNRRKRGSYKGKTYHRVEHVLVLEWIYNHHSKYPSRRLKKKLSFELGMSYSQIKIWFQSRRQRGKPVILTRDIVEDPFNDKQWSQVMERVQRMIAKEIEEEGSPSSGPPANIAPAAFAPTPGVPIGLPAPTTSDIKPVAGGATVFPTPTPQASSVSAPLPSISQIFPSLSPVNDHVFYFSPQDQQQQQQPHSPHAFHTPHHSSYLPPQLQSSPSYSQSVLKSKPNNQGGGRSSQSQFQFQFQFQPQSRPSPQVLSQQQQPSSSSSAPSLSQPQGSSQSQFQFQFQPHSQSHSQTPQSRSSQTQSPSQSPALVPLNFSLSSTKPLQSPGPQTFPSSQLPPLHLNSFLFGNESSTQQQQQQKANLPTQLPDLSFFLTNANNKASSQFPQ